MEPRDGGTWVALSGHITELADFGVLMTLRGPVRIDLGDVERINSLGVRTWVHFVRDCEAAEIPLSFERVAPVLVQQTSMISNFFGARSPVVSLQVPYLCPACNAEDLRLVPVSPGVPLDIATSIPCPKCQTAMQVDELEDMYTNLFDGR
jgi:hypothetical protein